MNQGRAKTPDLEALVEALWAIGEDGALPATLIGLGALSTNGIQAALEAGRDWDFPVIFLTSRNQVEAKSLGGGYVCGWDQQALAAAIRRGCEQTGFEGFCYVCRDHGGPWQRDEEYRASLPVEQAMERAVTSYRTDIAAGFDLLHIDPTKDPFIAQLPDLTVVSERAVQLIRACEEWRTETGAGKVCYEVGTEETVGGLTSPESFEGFIVELLARLRAEGLPRPLFIVGQTGTLIKMRQNIGQYDAASARELSRIARRHGLAFKEHNSDYLPADNLAQHPKWGITGANFAPSLGHAETAAYLELARQEERLGAEPSGFHQTLSDAAFSCGRWRKWLPPEHEGLDDHAVRSDPALFHDAVRTAGHYVLDVPAVAAAGERMFCNLKEAGVVPDPQRYVVDRVKAVIGAYARALGLFGITSRLQQVL